MMKRNRGLWALGVAGVGILALANVARADVNDVSTERTGSVVVFPKVVWDGTRDTIIQISNTTNGMVHAHCFYVDGASGCSETDFSIWLTKQQPTHWVASRGRRTAFDPFGSDGAGLDPGVVPPVPPGFFGELKCIQVDETGAPFRGDALKGEATIRYTGGDVSQYNAVAFHGNPDFGVQEGDPNDLFLDLTANNPFGEYSACPDVLIFNHFASGADDPVMQQAGNCSAGCPIETELTLVPCQQDLENQVPGRVTVQFEVFDEFEVAKSASVTVNCFLNSPISRLASIFTLPGGLATLSAQTRINPNPGNGGVIGIAEETRAGSGAAAYNLNIEGNRFDAATDGKGRPAVGGLDHIIVPLVP